MTNNLNLDQMTSGQNQKFQTNNDGNGQLDAAITATLTVTVTSTNAATVTQAQLQRANVLLVAPDGGDPPSAAITITVDTAFERGTFSVVNTTAEDVTITISGQSETAPVIPAGDSLVVLLDGSDVRGAASTDTGVTSKTEYLPAAAWQPATTAGSVTACGSLTAYTTTAGNPDLHGLPFAGDTANETAMIEFVMPSDWDGDVINFRINDAIPGGQTGGLDGRVWAVSAVAVAAGGTIDTAYGTAVNVTIDDSTSVARQRSSLSGDLTPAGSPAAGDMLFLRIDRLQDDGADDLDTDAIFLGLELTYGVA